MRIIGESKADDCFGTGLIREYELDNPVSREFLEALNGFGEVSVQEDRNHPFYTFDKEYFFTIKGLVGGKRIKVIYRQGALEHTKGFLDILLKELPGGNIEAVKKAEKKTKGEIDADKRDT